MNYGLKMARGECLIFKLWGYFFNSDSLNIMYNNLKRLKMRKVSYLGKQNFYSEDLFWEFPGKSINIKGGLKNLIQIISPCWLQAN